MKKKNEFWNFPIIAIGFMLILNNGCKKDDNNNPTNGKTTAVFNFQLAYGTMTDQDGNTYKTIKIGTQTWMAENLRTTKYRNSEAVPEVTDNTAWSNLSTGAYCNYKNTKNNDTIATYGRLYNWFTVLDSRNIAPTGWHVPSDAEWTILTTYLGDEMQAGEKMKESGTIHWQRLTDATNESGFTALPGGGRGVDSTFRYLGQYGYFWSSTEDGVGNAWIRDLSYRASQVNRNYSNGKGIGFSVRCIKD